MKPAFTILLALIFCAACSASKKPDIAGLSYACGSEDTAKAEAVVLVQTPEGGNLSAADIQELRAQFRTASEVQPLRPTSRGCLALPKADGVLEVQSPRAGWGLARAVDAKAIEHFVRWNLEPGGTYQFKLMCPTEGLFTSPRLTLPILGQVDGPSELFDLQLILRDAADQSQVIYEKKLGETLVQLPDSVDLLKLPEGSYTLDVRLRDLTRDWNADDPSRIQSCPVTLIRSVPGLNGTGLVNSLGLEIYRRGDTLPLTVSDPRSRLYVCREPSKVDDACEAAAACQNPENFTLASTVLLDEAGTYRYFLQAENIVKVRSRPQCHKVFVSAAPPLLTARWKSPVIDEENTVLREPRSILGVNIAVQHPVVPNAQVEETLQCRAEFLIGGILTRKGADVTCMSGRCQGRSLETWQACDGDLSFSIASALQVPSLLNSQLRVLIRSNDGAGQIQEITKSVWLQKSRWAMSKVSDADVYETALAADGSVIQVGGWGQTLQVKDGQSQPIPSPFENVNHVVLAQLTDKTVIGAFRIDDTTRFAKYDQGSWKPLTIQGWQDEYPSCGRLFPDEGNTFICSARGSLTRMNPDRVLQPVDGGEVPSCLGQSTSSLVRLGEADYVVNCKTALHRYDGKTKRWQNYDVSRLFQNPASSPIPQVVDGALERDGLGRVWFMAVADYQVAAGFFDSSGLHPVLAPVPRKPDFTSLTLARNSRGQIQVMDRVWDESSSSWQVLPTIQQAFPSGATIRVQRFADGGLLYESEHLLLHETAEGMVSMYPWKGLDLPNRLAVENLHRSSTGRIYILGKFALPSRTIRQLYQFKLGNWTSFGSPFLNLADTTHIPFPVLDKMRVLSVGQGSFALDDGAWTLFCREWSGGPYSTPFATSQGLYLGSFYGLLRCNPETNAWESVFTFDKTMDLNDWMIPKATNMVEDQWGRIWFGKGSGRMVYREGDKLKIFDWPVENGSINNLMLIRGRAATLGPNKLTVWNEGNHAFDVTPLEDLGIDPTFFGKVNATAQGLLIYAPDTDHFRILDLQHNTERTEKGRSGCLNFLSTSSGNLICVTSNSIYQQIPGQEWMFVAGPFNWTESDLLRAILERDRYLWIPAGKDMIRIDLPEFTTGE